MPPDISLVLTLHGEGPLVRRTLVSLEEAARFAAQFGISTELVTVLDRADAATHAALEAFDRSGFDVSRTIVVDNGSLGLSRNDGVAAASGRYLAMCDGDDLISFNALAETLRVAEAGPRRALYFPEWLIAFGHSPHAVRYYDLDRATPLAFLQMHPYNSRVFAHCDVFRSHPYRDVRLTRGYAYEDWDFNAACVADGLDIRVVPDTILFCRRRPGSLLGQMNQISVRQIPPNPLHAPGTFVWRGAEAYRRTQEAIERFRHEDHKSTAEDFARPVLRSLIRAANTIDPAVDTAALADPGNHYANVAERAIETGRAYLEICRGLEGQGPFDEVFLLPFAGLGGAELYFAHLMRTLRELRPQARVLVILGENPTGPEAPHAVPPGVTLVDIGGGWPSLPWEDRLMITLRLIEQLAPAARLHLRDSCFAAAFVGAYGTVLAGREIWFYRFNDGIRREAGETRDVANGFAIVSDHIARLTRVVYDTQGLAARDRDRIGLWPDRFTCLPNLGPPLTSPATIAARAAETRGRILWASRLDHQKRPELLPLIARRLAEVDPTLHIDVFGDAVLDRFDTASLQGHPNLTWHGAYAGFAALDAGAYDAFLYTSWRDGMPNVVLEAVAAGLPVIAPDIGGIGELLEGGRSGWLLPLIIDDAKAADACVTAIIRLVGDPWLRRTLAEAALSRLAPRHGQEAYRARLAALLASAAPPQQEAAA